MNSQMIKQFQDQRDAELNALKLAKMQEKIEKKSQLSKPSASKKIKKTVPLDPANGITEAQAKETESFLKKKSVCGQPGEGYVITEISKPQAIVDEKSKKKWLVNVRWVEKDGRKRSKVIRFGEKGKKDFIDGGDVAQRLAVLARLKKIDDPFHKNFYRAHLCNSNETDIKKAWLNLNEQLI